MKSLIKFFLFLIVVIIIVIYREPITNYVLDNFIFRKENKDIVYNEYYKDDNYLYVRNVNEFVVNDKQDILNTIYTVINSGIDNFSISCDKDYKSCTKDIEAIAYNQQLLSDINNFVSPYNTFDTVSINIHHYNNIEFNITHLYKDEEINYVNNFILEFINNNVNDSMSDYDKIKVFHDYVINNTIYDEVAAGLVNTENVTSNTAYLLLLNGKSICSGYSDIMAIYLDFLKIPNYRISSENHVWNLVYINNGWYHIDLTWDDPITNTGEQVLLHDYFIIDTNKLFSLDTIEHNYDTSKFLEAN